MEINQAGRSIRATILYYGPALGGKTTNLQVLHRMAVEARRGEMISINTMQDRTLLFDLLPLTTRGFRGYDLQIRLMAVPGQTMYAVSRRVALRTADAVVFVANSAADRVAENAQSLDELKEYLGVRAGDTPLPIVFQYNKRDLPSVAPVEHLDRALHLPANLAVPAVATEGRGLLETLGAVLTRLMQRLTARYPVMAEAPGHSIEQWVARTLRETFGAEASARPVGGSDPGVMALKVDTPIDDPSSTQPHGATLDSRLADRYARAAWQLSSALEDACSERDAAERRLQDLRHALAAAQALNAGRPLAETLQVLLGRMMEVSDAAAGAFLVPGPEGGLLTLALRGLPADPLAGLSRASREELPALAADQPVLLDASRSGAVGDLLHSAGAFLHAALSVPFRTRRGLQGLALLFYGVDQPRPRPRLLSHLAHMAGALEASLEVARYLRSRRLRAASGRQAGAGAPMSVAAVAGAVA